MVRADPHPRAVLAADPAPQCGDVAWSLLTLCRLQNWAWQAVQLLREEQLKQEELLLLDELQLLLLLLLAQL